MKEHKHNQCTTHLKGKESNIRYTNAFIEHTRTKTNTSEYGSAYTRPRYIMYFTITGQMYTSNEHIKFNFYSQLFILECVFLDSDA